jgi:hypothetical protein
VARSDGSAGIERQGRARKKLGSEVMRFWAYRISQFISPREGGGHKKSVRSDRRAQKGESVIFRRGDIAKSLGRNEY